MQRISSVKNFSPIMLINRCLLLIELCVHLLPLSIQIVLQALISKHDIFKVLYCVQCINCIDEIIQDNESCIVWLKARSANSQTLIWITTHRVWLCWRCSGCRQERDTPILLLNQRFPFIVEVKSCVIDLRFSWRCDFGLEILIDSYFIKHKQHNIFDQINLIASWLWQIIYHSFTMW